MSSSDSLVDAQFDSRLRWRCRRGLLELDLMLEHFLLKQYHQLNPSQKMQFLHLLELPDNELWDMITGKIAAKDDVHTLLNLLIAA